MAAAVISRQVFALSFVFCSNAEQYHKEDEFAKVFEDKLVSSALKNVGDENKNSLISMYENQRKTSV